MVPEQQAGDVVDATQFIGQVAQVLASRVQVPEVDFVVKLRSVKIAGQAVTAQQDGVAIMQLQVEEVGRDVFCGADGAGDDGAEALQLGRVHVFFADGAKANQLIDVGVVGGDLAPALALQQVGAAVTDVADDECVPGDGGGDHGGAHVVVLVAAAFAPDGAVGGGEGCVQVLFNRVGCGGVDRLRGKAGGCGAAGHEAGNFAAGGATHAVADQVQAAAPVDAIGVFVIGAHLADAGPCRGTNERTMRARTG